jgi:NDP-sugar pyrophosphorylase family protein
MQSVILAAGKGSRLHPITISRSKAMLPVLGKPIAQRVMENLASCGLRDFILVVNPQDREIREHFQRDSKLDVKLHFVDQPDRLGMADALKHAAPLIREDFVLSACDYLVTEEDVQSLISSWVKRPGLGALLSLIRIPMEDTGKTAIVTLEGDRVTSIVEKPAPDQARSNISSLPLYCFSPRILDYLTRVQLTQRGEYELQEAIQMMIAEDEDVHGLFFKSYRTLTSAEDLLELNLHSIKSDPGDLQVAPDVVGPGTNLVSPLHIEQGTVIGSGCTIGPNVYIEVNVRIGDHVRLQNVVVLRQAVIPDGVELSDQVVT